MSPPKLPTFKSKRHPKINAALAFGVLFLSLFLCGLLPTQWFAAKYGYDANLGPAMLRLGSIPVYWPLEWVSWGWRLGDVEELRSNVHFMAILGGCGVILSIIAAVITASFLGKYDNGMAGLHGTAHWAEKTDVNNTGFMSDKNHEARGVVVGSVMLDWRGRVIHPHHPKYANRYKPRMIRCEGWRGVLGMKRHERDSNGQPMYTVRKSVVKRVEVLYDGKNTHVFGFCPTRSGKGRGMVIPTLLTYRDSVMVNDPKGEAYALTSGFRKWAGQEIIKFEPANTDGTGARWNPLDEIRIYTQNDVQDAQMIMSMACDPKGEGLYDYFDKAGYEFLTALALHVRYAEDNGSLEGIARFLGDPRWDSDKQMYSHMLQSEHDPEGKMGWVDTGGEPTKTHPMVANAAKTMLNKEDKDRSGVLSTAKSLLSLYLDPIVAQNTRCSDFLVRDLMTNAKPVSLYYVVGPGDMQRLTPLTRLFYDLFIRRNASDMKFENGRSAKSYTFPLLMVIDEMTSLQKLPIIQEALGYVAGYGIRMFMLVQDIAQVEDIYGKEQTVESGAETRVVYAPNRTETAEKISRMAGKTTVTEVKATPSVDGLGFKSGSVSIGTEKHARDLITPEEVSSLNDQDVLIFVKGQPPIYGRKAFYDEDPVLKGRAMMPAPAKSSVLRAGVVPSTRSSVAAIDVAVKAEPSKEEIVSSMAEKWAASRQALQQRVQAQSAPQGQQRPVAGADEAPGNQSDELVVRPARASQPEQSQVAAQPTIKRRSRYAGAPELSAEARAKVNSMLADVVLMEKIANISAFPSTADTSSS